MPTSTIMNTADGMTGSAARGSAKRGSAKRGESASATPGAACGGGMGLTLGQLEFDAPIAPVGDLVFTGIERVEFAETGGRQTFGRYVIFDEEFHHRRRPRRRQFPVRRIKRRAIGRSSVWPSTLRTQSMSSGMVSAICDNVDAKLSSCARPSAPITASPVANSTSIERRSGRRRY